MSTHYRDLRRAVDRVVECEDKVTAARQALSEAEWAMGKVLRACRIHRGLTLRECARKVGVSAPYLGDVELGRRTISTGNLELLMDIVLPIRGMSPDGPNTQLTDAQRSVE